MKYIFNIYFGLNISKCVDKEMFRMKDILNDKMQKYLSLAELKFSFSKYAINRMTHTVTIFKSRQLYVSKDAADAL